MFKLYNCHDDKAVGVAVAWSQDTREDSTQGGGKESGLQGDGATGGGEIELRLPWNNLVIAWSSLSGLQGDGAKGGR